MGGKPVFDMSLAMQIEETIKFVDSLDLDFGLTSPDKNIPEKPGTGLGKRK